MDNTLSIGELITATFTNQKIIGSVSSTVLIILLGFLLRKIDVFTDQFGKVLSNVVLNAALPALAFNSFMKSINNDELQAGMSLLIWGFAIYIILIFVSKPLFLMYKGDKQTTLRVLTIFGSTTFFSLPIVGVIYGDIGILYGSIFNIAYRVFLYSYGYIKMSGLKMDKDNIKTMFLNPIVIATFLGLFIWVFQASLPQVTVAGEKVAFLRIDQTAIWLYQPMKYLAGLCSPMAWLAIGITLGQVSLKEAFLDKTVWYYSFVKVLIVPFINIIALIALNYFGILTIDFTAFAVVVLMMMAPPATVAVAYAISFNRDALLASNASLVSTIFAVFCISFWIVVLEIIKSLGIFQVL